MSDMSPTGSPESKKRLSQVGMDRFTLNRFLPIPISTDFENFNITDTDTDIEN